MIIELNGYKINYVDEGEGEPILFLHGWGSSLDVWSGIMNYLKTKGNFWLVALDFPGCGNSPIPEKPMDLNDYTELVVEFCRRLNIESPIMFGHSNGGRVTLSAVGQDLISPKKIVLFGSAGIKSKTTPQKAIKLASFKTAKFFLTLPVIKNYTEDLLNNVRRYFGSSDYNNAPEVMRKTLVSLVNSDITKLLPNVKAPTLLMWGSNDTATPLCDGKKMEKLIPDAGLCVFNGASHFALIERAGEVNLILNSFI